MPVSEKQKKWSAEYKAKKIKRIPLDVQRAMYDEIKSMADRSGESVNGYIKRAIRAQIETEEGSAEAQPIPD